ncbi:MAG: HEAT repeat domain-containing protein [Chroococcidiopsidaceae cyanobacterium CP_BM_ER_R8_30]|nr:HEAT repeat domain-containing protein [Chroococcidiopsidaceae cyanobacterium CP_BM_ER_R8_30]
METNSEEQPETNAQVLTVEQAIANLQHEDLSLRYYAAWWLGKFRVRDPAAVDALIAALEDEAHRIALGGYPLRRNAARALGKLGDQRAVPGLIRCLDCSDYYVREAAAQSLEMLGNPAAVPALIQLLEGGVAAAQQVPGRPHLAQPYEAVLEALGSLQARVAVPLIQPFLDHPIARVKYAALRAMYQLTEDDTYGQRLVQALEEGDMKLRRVVLLDLGAIGYLPAAESIAQCSVENSFKLIALKGLLEHGIEEVKLRSAVARGPLFVDPRSSHLPDTAIQVMNLMDSLL